MLLPAELREIADFCEKASGLIDAMVACKYVDINFDMDAPSRYTVSMKDGTLLGYINMENADQYEFFPKTGD